MIARLHGHTLKTVHIFMVAILSRFTLKTHTFFFVKTQKQMMSPAKVAIVKLMFIIPCNVANSHIHKTCLEVNYEVLIATAM
jgi:hypothetical protein